MSSCTRWQVTRTTGGASEITELDGLWRAKRTWNGAGYINRRFDHEGRETFVSYPSDNANTQTGVSTYYDALGRVTSTGQDSELGLLTTTTQYKGLGVPAHGRKVTDARGNVTTTSFASYAEPAQDTPVTIQRFAPGQTPPMQVTSLSRDLFGKIVNMTRSGTGVAVSRDYGYNPQQQLCRITEPESGTTVLGYDLAGNVSWRGKTTGTSCERGSATDVIDYDYDALNRLTSTTFPAGTAPIGQTWYADGSLHTIAQGPALWTYQYNGRRLLEKETLAVDGKSFQID